MHTHLKMFLEPALVEESLATDMTRPLRGGEVVRTDPQAREADLYLMFPAADTSRERVVTVETLELSRQL